MPIIIENCTRFDLPHSHIFSLFFFLCFWSVWSGRDDRSKERAHIHRFLRITDEIGKEQLHNGERRERSRGKNNARKKHFFFSKSFRSWVSLADDDDYFMVTVWRRQKCCERTILMHWNWTRLYLKIHWTLACDSFFSLLFVSFWQHSTLDSPKN